ncbi:MAG TPA: helix-turn-helix domain-containing protein [Anaerolineales bacterium]|jgi:excisionase family DNA binding protein|nr:helix-turn-helix domain-containing protein [Anaerolineales bacterium]
MTGEWLSLKGVAELLGVHPSTVRLWSNKGVLPTHRTSGGHRRYRRDDVMLWAKTAREVRVEPEGIMRLAMRNVRMQIGEANLESESWYEKLNEDARKQYRESARSLAQGLMVYLVSENQDDTEAHAIGYDYASRARRNGLSEVDATRALLFFRNALIESVMKVYREANILSGKAWEDILHKMHTFTDHILISLLETYHKLESANH